MSLQRLFHPTQSCHTSFSQSVLDVPPQKFGKCSQSPLPSPQRRCQCRKIHLTFAVLRGREGHLRQNRLLGLIVRITLLMSNVCVVAASDPQSKSLLMSNICGDAAEAPPRAAATDCRTAAAATAGAAAGTPFVISSSCLLAS